MKQGRDPVPLEALVLAVNLTAVFLPQLPKSVFSLNKGGVMPSTCSPFHVFFIGSEFIRGSDTIFIALKSGLP